jgi:alpha-1,6-mannosyltransferase
VAWSALLWAYAVGARLDDASITARLWTWGILLRVSGLLAQPVLEDDYFRYLWDGRQFALTGNPYWGRPSDHFGNAELPERFRVILDGVNYPEVPTIYGPVCQLAFLLSYWIAPGQWWPLKVILVCADLLTLRLLLGLAGPRRVLLYAWCPLLIQETAFNAHLEVLGLLPLMAAVHAWRSTRLRQVAVLCALAAGAKIFAWLLAPFLLARAAKKHWLLCLAMVSGLYLPFWLQGSAGDWAGLMTFARNWEFNSTVYAVFSQLAGEPTARIGGALLFASLWTIYFVRWRSLPGRAWPRGDWIYGTFFALAAVVNPWYLLWLLPFVVLFPSVTGVTALMVVSLSYAYGLNLGDDQLRVFQHPGWVRPVEAGAVLLAAFWDGRLLAAERKRG